LERTGWAQLKEYTLPKLIIIGEEDTTIVSGLFSGFFGDAGHYQIVTGADHSGRGLKTDQ